MLIVCPTCATSYQIKPDALGAGRNVRCAHCKNTWFATGESKAEATIVSAAAADRADAPARMPFDEPASASNAWPPSDTAAPRDENPFTIADAPPLVPQDQADKDSFVVKFDPGVPDGIDDDAARPRRAASVDRSEKRSLRQRLLSLPMFIVLLAAILLSTLNWRAAVVRQFPQTASLYAAIGLPVNLRGLFFENVRSTSEFNDGVTVLVVEGTIVNLTTRTLEVPRLRLALRNAAGHEVYAWTALPPKATLGSGNGLPFRARLASPPPDGRDVIVRFFNRRDSVAGL